MSGTITVENISEFDEAIRNHAEMVQADYECSSIFSFVDEVRDFASTLGVTYATPEAALAVKRLMHRYILEELGYEI